jgi:hypothetical protein
LGIGCEIKAVRNTLVSRAYVSLDFAFRALVSHLQPIASEALLKRFGQFRGLEAKAHAIPAGP